MIIQEFQSFKPKTTYFESKNGRKIKNSDKVLDAIKKLKNIKNRGLINEEVKKNIMSRNGQLRENFFEMNEDEVKLITSNNRMDSYKKNFYLSSTPSNNQKVNNDNSIDWKMVTLADENENLVSYSKKVWNKKRMKYVGKTFNSAGKDLDKYQDDKKEYQRKTQKLKKKFNIWKKKQGVESRKDGEIENTDLSKRMYRSFQERKRQNFKVDKKDHSKAPPSKKFGNGHSKKNKMKKLSKKFKKN